MTVGWQPDRGFGILSSDIYVYGEGVDEVYPDVPSTLECLIELLSQRKRTGPPDITILGELRRSRKMSQEELAARLHVRQAAISMFERRRDVLISTLNRFVAAMGGQLEIRATFPDGVVIFPSAYQRRGDKQAVATEPR